MWFKARASWLDKIESELLAYPNGAHDDVIDALAYMEQMASEPFNNGYDRDYNGGSESDEWNPTRRRSRPAR